MVSTLGVPVPSNQPMIFSLMTSVLLGPTATASVMFSFNSVTTTLLVFVQGPSFHLLVGARDADFLSLLFEDGRSAHRTSFSLGLDTFSTVFNFVPLPVRNPFLRPGDHFRSFWSRSHYCFPLRQRRFWMMIFSCDVPLGFSCRPRPPCLFKGLSFLTGKSLLLVLTFDAQIERGYETHGRRPDSFFFQL